MLWAIRAQRATYAGTPSNMIYYMIYAMGYTHIRAHARVTTSLSFEYLANTRAEGNIRAYAYYFIITKPPRHTHARAEDCIYATGTHAFEYLVLEGLPATRCTHACSTGLHIRVRTHRRYQVIYTTI